MPTVTITSPFAMYHGDNLVGSSPSGNWYGGAIGLRSGRSTDEYGNHYFYIANIQLDMRNTVPAGATVSQARLDTYLDTTRGGMIVGNPGTHTVYLTSYPAANGTSGVAPSYGPHVGYMTQSTGWSTNYLYTSVIESAAKGNTYVGILISGPSYSQGATDFTQWIDGQNNPPYSTYFTLQITYNSPPTTPGAWTSPTGGVVTGTITAAHGTSTDPDGETVTYQNDLWNGSSWIAQSAGLSFSFNSTSYPNGNSYKFRTRATDGSLFSAYTESNTFTITNTTQTQQMVI